MKPVKLILAVACFLLLSRPGLADAILVGTTLTSVSPGAGLCPSGADCSRIEQQFTLLDTVVIDQIKVLVGGPYLFDSAGAAFSVSLTGNGIIGTGFLTFPQNGDLTAQVFDFSGLNIQMGPGTYDLEVTGGNLTWLSGDPLVTSAGTIGPMLKCDPTVQLCDDQSQWQSFDSARGMEIDGTVVPEPSSWLLFGTGLLGLCGITRRRWLYLSV